MTNASQSVATGEVTAGQAVQQSWGYGADMNAVAGGGQAQPHGFLPGTQAANVTAPSLSALSTNAPTSTGMMPSYTAPQISSMEASASVLEAPKSTGMMAWLKDNPVVTMLLGQGVMGAAAGYEADRQATKRQEMYEDRLKDRGLYGYDYGGNYAGVVNSQRPAVKPAVTEPSTPAIEPPSVAPPTPARTPVPREQLPQLLEKGQLA
jgi:hypothetical protein